MNPGMVVKEVAGLAWLALPSSILCRAVLQRDLDVNEDLDSQSRIE